MPCRETLSSFALRTLLALSFVIGCAAPQSAPAQAQAPSAQAPEAASPSAPVSAPPAVADAGSAAKPAALCDSVAHGSAPAGLPLQFTLERQSAVTSLAVNERKLAVLGEERVAIFDGARWTELPALEASRGARHIELFFGRDDQPRLMGYVSGSGADTTLEPFYRRFKAGRWQREPGELGALASGSGPLYGVLGVLDPEVVCRPKAICLVKRLSGWARIPAHDASVRIQLAGNTAWALWPGHLQRLESAGFADFDPAREWRDPSSVWVEPAGVVWVLEPGERALFRLEGKAWSRYESPLREPSALGGSAANGLWLVGGGGAAHFDGSAWRCVPDVRGPLSALAPLGADLWLAGGAGVFRGRRPEASAR